MNYKCGCITTEQQALVTVDGLKICFTCGEVATPDEKGKQVFIDKHRENAQSWQHNHGKQKAGR